MFGMALLLGSIAAIGVLSKRKVNGTLAPSEAELERLRVTGEREEFDEWVSAGTLPDEVRERSRVTVASLEDLVDVAIDCDRRVIEDETEEGGTAYYVVDGDLLYVYEFEEVPDPNADEFGETFVDGERNGLTTKSSSTRGAIAMLRLTPKSSRSRSGTTRANRTTTDAARAEWLPKAVRRGPQRRYSFFSLLAGSSSTVSAWMTISSSFSSRSPASSPLVIVRRPIHVHSPTGSPIGVVS